MPDKLFDYIDQHLEDSIAELARLCAQPSISAQGLGTRECAALVAERLRARGFQAEVIPTPGQPIVYAEAAGRSERTLLFYNHYDVQPPEPLEEWTSPPFTPTIRDGKLYARGARGDALPGGRDRRLPQQPAEVVQGVVDLLVHIRFQGIQGDTSGGNPRGSVPFPLLSSRVELSLWTRRRAPAG